MDPQFQEMLDHYLIRKTLSEYCHGCDRCDEQVMRSIYLEDSWDDHGRYCASGPEFVRQMAAAVQTTTNTLSHLLGQSLINVEGNEAGAETYFFAVSTSTGDEGGEMCNQLGGRFVDRLQRENGRWLVKHRTVVRDWAISMPIQADWTAEAGLKEGSRCGDDPSRAVLTIGLPKQP